MSTEEFNQHLSGALYHPMPMFGMLRLSMALKHVVDATGDAGATALREWCQERDAKDNDPLEAPG